MTKADAKRYVCGAFAAHMDNGSVNAWAPGKSDGGDLPDADAARVQAAFKELLAELRRRATPPKK